MFNYVSKPVVRRGFGPVAEKTDAEMDMVSFYLRKFVPVPHWLSWKRMHSFPGKVDAADESMGFSGQSDDELEKSLHCLRQDIRCGDVRDASVAVVFALVREMAHRILGMRHYPTQLMAGWALMHGMVLEMNTGEGKTFAATLPACTAALAGIPVHVITANDYLAERDASLLETLYEAMGLSVGVVLHGMSPQERRRAYQCDVVYCSNKEIVFDYLRDGISGGDKRGHIRRKISDLASKKNDACRVMRGLHFAIIDEADSILIDEARTPLIITGQEGNEINSQDIYYAMKFSDDLKDNNDFHVKPQDMNVELMASGKAKVAAYGGDIGGSWRNKVWAEEWIRQALTAKYIFHRDEQYIIKDGRVVIVDEQTGRGMPDRSWERGLHQMIEYKESCDITSPRSTQARISYQQFFQRYIHLAGMTGTAREVRRELWVIYGLPFVRVPTHRKTIRRHEASNVFVTQQKKLDAMSRRISKMQTLGRPVLIGVRTVQMSEKLSSRLNDDGIHHSLLNARQGEEEAKIIAKAGEPGQVTIATNMAGRGTDIRLGKGVGSIGGLHVILSERHDSKRVDRQLIGRCGRQGDSGSYEYMLSMEDELFRMFDLKIMQRLMTGVLHMNHYWGEKIGFIWSCMLQYMVTHRHYRMRCEVLKQDRKLSDILAFSGERE